MSNGDTTVALPPARATRILNDRLLGGVAAGIARHLNTRVGLVRALFLATSFLDGAGVIAYLLLWAFMPKELFFTAPTGQLQSTVPLAPTTDIPARNAAGAGATPVSSRPWGSEIHQSRIAWAALVVILIFIAQSWFPNDGWLGRSLSIPALMILGTIVMIGVIWALADRVGAQYSFLVYLFGSTVTLIGLGVVTASQLGLNAVLWGFTSALLILAALLIMLAPWLIQRVTANREQGIELARQSERETLAARVHDSVMQTLTLIQRHADQPSTVRQLARSEEQALRSWLYTSPATESTAGNMQFMHVLQAAVDRVEERYAVAIDVVRVGDAPIDAATQELIHAATEAMTNAAQHGNGAAINVFAEISDDSIDVFVRDRGPGFDVDAIDENRRGVRHSILRRMERLDGSASIRSNTMGTEVRLTLPGSPGSA